MGKRNEVEKRIRLDSDLGTRLEVAAATRGQTVSEFVAWALVPHLQFDLPTLPEVGTGLLRVHQPRRAACQGE